MEYTPQFTYNEQFWKEWEHESQTQSSYNMAQLCSGTVNNINALYAQQQPPKTNVTTFRGSVHNYSNQTMFSQPQTSFVQNQTFYS